MLPDIGASELMVIALVALIFVGPKDLPMMLKKLGQFTSKMRRMAADFRTSFDDMARQSELEDLRREVEEMRANATHAMDDPIGIDSTLRETIDEIDAAMVGGEPYELPPEPVVTEVPKPPRKRPASKKAAAADTGVAEKPAPKTARKPSTSASAKAPSTKRAVAKPRAATKAAS